MARLLGEIAGVDRVLFDDVQGLQQRGGEAAGGPEPGPRRDVRHAGDLEVGRAVQHQLQRLPNDRVLHFVHALDPFQARVFKDQLRHKRLVRRDADVLVNGCGDQKARVFAIIRRQVGAAAPQRDS